MPKASVRGEDGAKKPVGRELPKTNLNRTRSARIFLKKHLNTKVTIQGAVQLLRVGSNFFLLFFSFRCIINRIYRRQY